MNSIAILHEAKKRRNSQADAPLAPGDLVAITSINRMADEGALGRIVTIDDEGITFVHLGAWYAETALPAYHEVWELPWCWISSVARVPAQTHRVAS